MKHFATLFIFICLIHISLQEDCGWSIHKLPKPQALYIIPDGDKKDITSFWLPQSEDSVTVPFGKTVLFACPGGELKNVKEPEANLTCVGKNKFKSSSGTEYSFASLSCTTVPAHKAKKTGKCGGSRRTDSSTCDSSECSESQPSMYEPYDLIDIGFELPKGGFYTIMQVCFNDNTKDAVYSVHLQTNAIKVHEEGYPRPKFKEGSGFYPSEMLVDGLYSQPSQLGTIAKAVGSMAQAQKYIKTGIFLSRGHLTPRADYVHGLHQRATFYFMNVAPQWATFNSEKWNNLETDVKKFSAKNQNNLLIYTGTHGIMTLKDVNGNEVPIYLYYDADGQGKIKSPLFFWKVLYEPGTGKGVAFVALNNPYIKDPVTEYSDLCDDICNKLSWLTWNQKEGFGLCCEVKNLMLHIPEIPPLHIEGLLL